MLDAVKLTITGDARTAAALNQVKGELGGVKGALRSVKETALSVGKSMRNVGAGMTAGITAPLALAGRQAVQLYDTQLKAEAAVETAIQSTGGAAGKTAAELFNMASELQQVSNFGDEDILKNVTAQMLTFTNVAGDQFGMAQQAVLDLATAQGVDLKSASIMVGKALNDPIKGVSALSEAGTQFTESQKDMIESLVETGDVAGAQSLILEELGKQYGGQAEAARNTPEGEWLQLSMAIGDVKEALGEQIVPFIQPIVAQVREAVDWFAELSPEIKKNVVVIGGLAAAAGPLIASMGLVTIGATKVAGAVKLMGLAAMANPIFAAAAGLAVVGTLIYQNWDRIGPWFEGVWGRLSTAVSDGWANIKGWLDEFTPDSIKFAWGGLSGWYSLQWRIVKGTFEFGWDAIKGLVSGRYTFRQVVANGWEGLTTFFSDELWPGVKQTFSDAWEGIKAEVAGWPGEMMQVGRDIVQGIIDGIRDRRGGLDAEAGELADRAVRTTKHRLRIESPSKEFMDIGRDVVEGLGLGISNNAGTAEAEIVELMKTTTDAADQASPMGQQFSQAFASIVTGASSARDAVTSFFSSLANRAATRTGDLIWASLGLDSMFANLFPAVTATPGVTAFASGGVITHRTHFGYGGGRGVMGEAGPEAILPLERVGSALGVRASAPEPVEVKVNIIGDLGGFEPSIENGQGGPTIGLDLGDLLNQALRSGRVDGTMRDLYGLSRRPRGF